MAKERVDFNSGGPAGPPRHAARSYNLYYVYADTDDAYLLKLEQHLQVLERKQLFRGWHRRKVTAGEDWQSVANQHFEQADIILLLVSPALLDSKYVYDTEVEQAMLRHAKGEVVVVPVLVLPCMWELTPFESCAPLPSNANFVSRCARRSVSTAARSPSSRRGSTGWARACCTGARSSRCCC